MNQELNLTPMEEVQQDLRQLESTVAGIATNVNSILQIVKGNELDKADQGMVGDIHQLKQRVSVLEKWKDRIVWMFIGMGIPAGIGVMEILRTIITSGK